MRVTRDLAAGTTFAAMGVLGLSQALDLPIGTLGRVGPGAFPIFLSGLVMVLGGAIALRAVIAADDPRLSIGWRPFFVILAALMAVAFALPFAGLVAGALLAVAISSLAIAGASLWRTAFLSIVLTGLVVGIFKVGLNLPLALWPGW